MRCLIFSANALFGECLCHGLAAHARVDAAHLCCDITQLDTLIRTHEISSVLIDMNTCEGAAVLRHLRFGAQRVCVLALAIDDRAPDTVIDCARAGCHGIVPRNVSLDDVVGIVAAAERGEVAMRPEVVARMMSALAAPPAPSVDQDQAPLTRREKEICALVAEGLTNKEIACEVGRSVGTVKNHVRSILAKLDVPRRSAITAHLTRDRQPAAMEFPTLRGAVR